MIRPLFAKFTPGSDTINITTQIPEDQQGIVDFARAGVRSSTTAAAKFVEDLREDHFHMFWPHWCQVAFSCIGFQQLMLAISAPDTQDAVERFRELQMIRREMRLKSNMLPVLRLGVLRIDAIFWKGVDKVLHLQPHVKDALEISLLPE